MKNQDIEIALQWRYAVKKFDATKKISAADWQTLKSSMVLAPSSFGIQPWKFLSIETPALREKLRAVSWNQSQTVEASHYLVFLYRDKITETEVENYISHMSSVRGAPVASLQGLRDMLHANVVKTDPAWLSNWAHRQTYIAMGFLLETAALLKIDATPMEGFDAAQYNKILELEGTGWKSGVCVALGYRHADDNFQTLKKVRFHEKDLVEVR